MQWRQRQTPLQQQVSAVLCARAARNACTGTASTVARSIMSTISSRIMRRSKATRSIPGKTARRKDDPLAIVPVVSMLGFGVLGLGLSGIAFVVAPVAA